MALQLTGVLLLCLIQTGLAAFVFLRDPKRLVNRLFGLSMISITGWIGCITLSLSSFEPTRGLVLGRLAFAFAAAIPFSLLWMFEAFSQPYDKPSRVKVAVPGLFCAFFVFLSLSPWILAGWHATSPRPRFTYGPLHPLFGIYFIMCFAFALYTLWERIRLASGIRKLQLRYLLLGILIGGAGGITTNLIIPLVWKTSRYSLLGPYFTLVLSLFSAHAIIRYRLMDIRVFVRNGVVYVGATAIAATAFVAFAAALGAATGYSEEQLSVSSALALAIVMAIFFHPLKEAVQHSLNRYLYRRSYDYQRIVREASRLLSTNLDFESLLNRLLQLVESTLKSEMISVYLRDETNETFSRRIVTSSRRTEDTLPANLLLASSALVSCLEQKLEPLVREEATLTLTNQAHIEAAQQLLDLGGEVALPMLQDRRVFGILLIGPKLSGDPYFVDDIELLSTLVSQASIAIKNAQLYSEVVLVNEYVENILSTMENAVIAVDAEGSVTLFNSGAQRLLRLDVSQAKGSHLRQLPVPVAAPLEATLATGQPQVQIETTLKDRAGTLRPAICSTSPLRDRLGKTLGAVAVFSDLTRLKSLEEQKRLAERFASIGALAAGIAHEIKNPLVAIKTFAELLPERFTEEDFRTDFSQVVIREIERIDDLVARLRGLAAAPTPQRVRLNLRTPLEETLALLRGQFEQAQVVVKSSYDADLPLVVGDAAQLKQLFLNLLVNALEAMDPGSDLHVRMTTHRVDTKDALVVEVADTGCGIPENLLGKIFDPFVTTKPRGSGLGLSICRGIAEAHGAMIRASNNATGRGATVSVEFPAYEPGSIVVEQSILSRANTTNSP